MKTLKILAIVFVCLAGIFTLRAADDKPIAFEALPAKSQAFIKQHFSDINISYSKVDREIFDTSYEVFLVDGTKVEFDRRGDWEKVDRFNKVVPSEIIPPMITEFVNKNHQGMGIVKIDRDTRDYEVELVNGLEIKFDLRFNVIGYDD